MASSADPDKLKTSAFGVEPGYPPYKLRQARYQAMGEDVGKFVAARKNAGLPKPRLLDVGMAFGITARYCEPHFDLNDVEWHGVDLFVRGKTGRVYGEERWTIHEQDLEKGLPFLEDEEYDIIVCEQILEHLDNAPRLLSELVRVARPGALLVIGVPTFLPGLAWIRQEVIGRIWKRLGIASPHKRAFSKASFVRFLKRHPELSIADVRGFRMISGGPLRPLEYREWWWKLNRRLGSLFPSLCIEIQALVRKAAS